MKKYFDRITAKPDKNVTNAFLMAISKPRTKNNDLLIAQLSTFGLILVITITLIAIFGI